MGKPWYREDETLAALFMAALYGGMALWVMVALLQDWARMQ